MNLTAKLRARRVESRNRRAVNNALAQAKTPAMRDEILAVASGKRTKSELLGFGDEEFVPWQPGPTM